MSLEQLDAFLLHARQDAGLRDRLGQPLELEEFLALARAEGFAVQESDVLAAQQREEAGLSDEELQHRVAHDACRLRTFIPS
ncbi:MAG: Nif11-like leader peptide family RiPP precursor [Synechococcus sp.]